MLWSRAKLPPRTPGIEDDGGALRRHGARAERALARRGRRDRRRGRGGGRERDAEPPAETFYGGYAGVFRDPDGHVWEIAHNPGFTLAEDGALVLPDFG